MAKLFIPNLFEYLYDFIQRKGSNYLFSVLEREDYLKVRTDSKIKHFAEKSWLDEIIVLCSKIGMGCALVMWDKENEKSVKVQDVLIGYLDTPAHNLSSQIVKDKVFATMDIDFIRSLQTVSKVSHGRSYSINRKYLQVKDQAQSKLPARTLVDKIQADRNLNWYSQTIQAALDIEPMLEGFKIDVNQFRILLYLQTSPNGATKEHIAKKLDRTHVAGLLEFMENMNMISYDRTNKNVIHIGVYGLMVLDQIFSKFP